MKKIFTLLFAVGMLAVTAQAQLGQRDNRQFDQQNGQKDFKNGYGNGKEVVVNNKPFDKDGRYDDKFSMDRKKEMEIAQINQEYDMKIQKVKRNFFLTWFEKQRQIRSLDQQRQREISMVNVKYTYSKKSDFGRDDHSNRHY